MTVCLPVSDEPFVTSGTGLHTPRTGHTAYNSQSKPKRPSARDFGPSVKGKTVYFAKYVGVTEISFGSE